MRRRLLPANTFLESKRDHPDAAVAVIIESFRQDISLLLIRRSERSGDYWSGQISFPGGHKTPIDRTFLETAIRESSEEVGISLETHILLGVLPPVYARTHRVKVAPFVFQLKNSVEIHPNNEVATAFWVPISELEKSPVIRSKVKVERVFVVDSYVYKENIIWGLTFRIINLLLGKK